MADNKPLVIVLSKNYYAGLGVIRSFGSAGYSVDVIAKASDKGRAEVVSKSRYVGNFTEIIATQSKNGKDTTGKKIVAKLMEYTAQVAEWQEKPVVFPADEEMAAFVDHNRLTLGKYFIIPQFEAGNIAKHSKQKLQDDFAAQAGLRLRGVWRILLDEQIEIPEDMIYPCVFKSAPVDESGRREDVICHSEEELAQQLAVLRAAEVRPAVRVREVVEYEGEVEVAGVAASQNVVVAVCTEKTKSAQYRESFVLEGEIVSAQQLGEDKNKIAEMIKLFGYTGAFTVKFKKYAGKLYFDRVEFRISASCHACSEMGVNMPELFAKMAAGEEYTDLETRAEDVKKTFIWDHIAGNDYIRGYITRAELEEMVAAADITMLRDENDPEPYEFVLANNLVEKQTRMDKNKPLVIVLSRSYYAGLGVVRALGSAGYRVDVIAKVTAEGKAEILAKSRYTNNFTEVVATQSKAGKDTTGKKIIAELKKYIAHIDDYKTEPVIFPADEEMAALVDRNRITLGEYFVIPHFEEDNLAKHTAAALQKEYAEKAGVNVAKSWKISLEDEVSVPEDMVYPCTLRCAEETVTCTDSEELAQHLSVLKNEEGRTSVTVNEMVEFDGEVDVAGVAADQYVVLPTFIRRTKSAQYRESFLLAGEIMSTEELGEYTEAIAQMVRLYGFTGAFTAKFRTSGEKLYFDKIVFNIGATNYAAFKMGANLPEMFVKLASGGELTETETKADSQKKSFICDNIAWNDYLRDYITKSALENQIAEADITLVKNDDDPQPYNLVAQKTEADKKHKAEKAFKKNVEGKKRVIKNFIDKIVGAIKAVFQRLPQTKAENKRNPESEKPRVIISGRNYSSNLCLARSFGMAGYEVEILRIFHRKPKRNDVMRRMKPDAYSKYVKAYYECITNNKNYNIKNKLIELADKNRKMLLIPADDLVASAVDRYYDELKPYYLMPNINDTAGAIGEMMSKRAQTELARAAGLPVVNSTLITVKKGGKVKVPETVNFPCFIKPNVSKNGSKGKMKKCEDRKDLIMTLKQYAETKSIEFLVEDFLNIKRECSLLGLSTKDGVVIPGFFGAELGGHGAHRGVALTGRILPTSQQQELIDQIRDFIATIGYEGLFDVDLIETEEGKMYFVELNLRYGGSGYAVTRSGANLPGMFADYMLLGKPADLNITVEQAGKTFVSEKIAIDEYAAGFITREEMDAVIAGADINFIKDTEDPDAFAHFEKFYGAAAKVRENEANAAFIAENGTFAQRTKKAYSKWKEERETAAKARKLGYPQLKEENKRNPQSELPRVIISGRNYSSNLCLARSFGMAGYEVEILRIYHRKPKKDDVMRQMIPDAYSKYVKAYYECVTNNKNYNIRDKLIELAEEGRKMLLVPADDLVASAVDRYYDELKPYYLMPNINDEAGAVGDMMSKRQQTELAREAGLPVVNSTLITVKKGGKVSVPESVNFPCFIKPNVSKNGSKGKMKRCDSRKELISTLKQYAETKSIEFLVEDFLNIKRECSLLGLSTKDGVVMAGFFGAELGGHGAHRGVALTGRVQPTEPYQELFDQIRDFIGTLGYEGLFDVDLIETEEGKMYFVELNLRYGGSGYSMTKSGANMPGMFADYMIKGIPADLDCRVTETGKSFVSEKIAIDEYAAGFITLEEMEQVIDSADINFIKDAEDPAPFEHFKKFYTAAGQVREAEAQAKFAQDEGDFVTRTKRKAKKALETAAFNAKAKAENYPQLKAENKRNPESEKPRVIISGRNYSSNLCLARSFGMAGYEVEILRIFHRKPKRNDTMRRMKPDAYSKYVKAYYECITNNKNYNIRNKLIELADTDRKMLLIPADDLVASAVDRYYDDLKPYYLMPNINDEAGAVGDMMSKRQQTELAREAGLPVVNSTLITVKKGGKVKVPESVNFPCFIKPNVSKNGSKGKMKKCEDRKDLIITLKQYAEAKKIEFLVEDFLNIKRECSLLGLSTKDGVVMAGFFGAELGGHGAHRGVALTGRVQPTEPYQELFDQIRDFIATLGYEGLFDVDLIETEEGKMYFVELNLRYGGSGYSMTKSGANMPGMFADYMTAGKPVDLDCRVTETGKSFVSEKIAIDEYAAGFITLEEMEQVIDSADINFIKDAEDPAPFEHFRKYYGAAGKVRADEEKAKLVAKEGDFATRTKRKIKRKIKKSLRTVKYTLLGYPQMKKENQRNPESEKTRIIVSGRNCCSNLSLARSFGEAGYEVEILRIFQKKPRLLNPMKMLKPDAYSRYIKAYQICVTNNKDFRIKNKLIEMADKNRKMLLIPADDVVVGAVDKYYKELSEYYIIPNINDEAGAINKMMNKDLQKKLAAQAGLPVVNSTLITVKKGGRVKVPETVSYPCFLKPNVSKNSFKVRMKKCESEEELAKLLKKYSRSKKIEMLAEDFLDIRREYSLLGLSTKDGVTVPGFFGAEIGGHLSHRGVAMTGRILPVSQQQELVEKVKQFVASTGYEGLFDVDLIEDKDGNMYFVELNLRYGGSGYAVTKCGANLPGMFADYMLLGKLADLNVEVKETDKVFISEKVMIDEYMHGFITNEQMKKQFAEADIHFIYSEEDPQAYRHFKKFYPVAKVMKQYYKKH